MLKATEQNFLLYPAIDLKDGHCVRLYQGDYTKSTVYAPDPIAALTAFMQAGAQWVHIVDLNGAKNPQQRQDQLITTLIQQQTVSIQLGGGIRTRAQVQKLLDAGVARVVIGSLAIQQPEEVKSWWRYFGTEHLALAVDVTQEDNGEIYVATEAWQQRKQALLRTLLEFYQGVGLKHVLCTDINRDGTLQGPNLPLYQDILRHFPNLSLQASGGIQSLTDIKNLRQHGLSGAVIGKALYEKQFTLQDALTC